MKFLNFDFFIPFAYRTDPYVYRKARLLVKTSFITSIFSLFYFINTTILNMHYSQMAMMYNVVSFLLIPFFFRWGLPGVWASNLYILTGAIGVSICTLSNGIVESSTIIWLALLPVVSLMLSNKLNAWIWTLTAYTTVVVFGIIHYRKLISIDEVPPEYNTIFEIANITGFVLIVFLVVLVFQNITDNTLKTISEKNGLLQQEKQKSERSFQELKATQAQLIHAEKMASLGELTAGIAHEIQNPLNFVNNFSEVSADLLQELQEELAKGNTDETAAIIADVIVNLQKVTEHGKRADAIVKGMLQHARNNTGKKELTDINALADEFLRLSFHGLRAKDKVFSADFKTALDAGIGKMNVVPQDIGRVFLNLCNNAFYAVNEKKKTAPDAYKPLVRLSTTQSNGKVIITVKDNGNGIPQTALDKIYQPFFTTKPSGQGTGLGLSLSYDIVKAHGGEMKVDTKEGEGTAFTITLPV